MNLNRRLWSLLTFFVFPLTAFPAPTVSPLPNVVVTTRGQSVVIYGSGFSDAAPLAVCLRSGKEAKGDNGCHLKAMLNGSQSSAPVLATTPTGSTPTTSQIVTFKIPNDQSTGDFLIFLDQGDQEIAVPGGLRIVPDDLGKITLDSVSPSTIYPDKGQKASGRLNFEFALSGQNLAMHPNDNTLISSNRGPVAVGTDKQCDEWRKTGSFESVCLAYDAGLEGQKLKVSGYQPDRYEGPVSFQIRVGNNISNPIKTTFSGVRAEVIRWIAIVLFLVLAAVTFLLVLRGIRLSNLAGEKTGPLAAFFLDRQTNSFSLSKFQLFAWTAVSVFGYVYLFLCRNYVQWISSLPPLPDNLPTLLGISAGTTVAAIGITVNRGSKGSGPLHPSLADFISTGGLVAGERFQFFIWTLVGCLGFVGVILHADPAALTQLPAIDGNLLTLMGISSAGYLAGKIVRQPGPIIELITITEATTASATNKALLKIDIKGQNLLPSAVVKVDQDELRMDQFSIVGDSQSKQTGTDFYSKMVVTLLDAEKYLTGSHLLYLVNDDGQSACEAFPLHALCIDENQRITRNNASTLVSITGTNFAEKLVGSWTAPGATSSQPLTQTDIIFVDQNHLTITLVPGSAGKGKLVLETDIHLSAMADVNVV